jgi:transposase
MSFAGADLHKRVTQLAVLRDGQPPSQFRFPNDPNTVQAVLRKLPRGTKIAVEATGSWWNPQCPSLRKPHAGQSKKLSSKKYETNAPREKSSLALAGILVIQ